MTNKEYYENRIAELEQAIKDANDWLVQYEDVTLLYYAKFYFGSNTETKNNESYKLIDKVIHSTD